MLMAPIVLILIVARVGGLLETVKALGFLALLTGLAEAIVFKLKLRQFGRLFELPRIGTGPNRSLKRTPLWNSNKLADALAHHGHSLSLEMSIFEECPTFYSSIAEEDYPPPSATLPTSGKLAVRGRCWKRRTPFSLVLVDVGSNKYGIFASKLG
ncbi:putative ribonuclease H protein [Senna tora]|uniref:Putative ribonuclease H protein n=1 Tax=Senna tora TaxID=362788 RepID=A0A834W8B5_9FABA|nr:putative ribonuclease H protein [Senna tora]